MRIPSVVFLVLFAFAAGTSAQSVRWEPGAGSLALNQPSELTLVFDQCEPSGTVTPPAVDGLAFGTPSKSEQSSFSVINGKASRARTVSLVYRVRPTERRPLKIPAFTVETDKGRQTVAAAAYEIGDATVGQSGLSLEAVAEAHFTPPPSAVWAGEVFPLTYTLNATKRYLYNINKDFDWNPTPLSIEPWGNPEQLEALINSETRLSVFYKTRASAKTPGTLSLNPATQIVNIASGSSPFGMFSRPNLEQFVITSKRADLIVRPLPLPAPASFNGAVGKFTLDAKVVPATATVGEPITWTLTLDGTGNWPDLPGLPSRSVSKDFRIVQPQAKRTNKEGSTFDAALTEDIVLIPGKPGTYTLGPVTFTVFDPATGTYQTLATKPVTLTITAGATPDAPSAKSDLSGLAQSDPASGANQPPAEIKPPAPIPRDPLPLDQAGAAPPRSRQTVLVGSLTALLCPLLAWLSLALRRARLTDPRLPLRAARRRLTATLAALRSSPDATATAPLLLQWQHNTARLWQLPQAVPTAAAFADPAWSSLWNETDRALYGTSRELSVDWLARAEQALAAYRVPAFSPFQLFLPRNLLPLAVVVSIFLASQPVQAADGRAAYDQGDFSGAEAAWSEAIKTDPTNWAAHHNLALALIQQNRAPEAAGQALAAFVQYPQNPSVRWHLAYAFKAAGLNPAPLAPFLNETPAGALARLASPTRWQFALIGAAWTGGLALAFAAWIAYARRPHLRWLAWTILGAAGALALASGWSLQTYGKLADRHAVLVVKSATLRSIPTELDTPQKASALGVGSLAITTKTFLGWRQLAFSDGQTGWVRAEDIAPLWE